MGQCVASEHVPCAGGRPADGATLRRATGSVGEALGRALKSFRASATAACRAAGIDGAQCLAAACDFVESLLAGVHSHLPDAIVDVELSSGKPGELASISVEFTGGPIIGEFATRSRQPVELWLQKRVSFSIRRPASDDFTSEPLVLDMSGVEQHVLPEIAELRKRLRVELASWPDGWHPRSAGTWWKNKREMEFPLETSKLRRLCDSFTEVASLPQYFQGMAFWGYLHITSRFLDSFEFYIEGSDVTVTAQARLLHPEEEELMDVGRSLCSDMLRTHRPLAEHFAASTVNMGALFEGRALGQKGANPAKIAKLFSAAKHWGPGEDRWHRLDETWLCVDTKDWRGKVIEEQGRVVWHAPGAPRAGDGRVQTGTPPAAIASAAPKRGAEVGRAGCSGFAMVALGLLLLLPTIVPVAASAALDVGLH